MTRPLLLASCLVLCVALGASPISAQESGFWQDLADPQGPAYDANAARALDALERGDDELLAAAAQEAQLRKPGAPMTLWLQALLAQRRGEHRQALALMDQLPRPLPEKIPGYLLLHQRAVSLYALGQPEEAIAALRSIPARQHSVDTLPRLGMLLWLQGRPEEALEPLQRAHRLGGRQDPLTLGALGLVLSLTGQRQQARPYLLALAQQVLLQGDKAWPAPEGFWRAGDATLLRALVYEEAGRQAQARAALLEVLKQDSSLVPQETQRRLLEEGKPVVLAVGQLPMESPSAALADPQGRYLILGDKLGRLWMVNLARQEALHTPSLSGPPVHDLAMRADGKLLVAFEDSYLGLYDLARGPRLVDTPGPVAMPNGTTPRGLTLDGRAVLATTSRSVIWSMGRVESPSEPMGTTNLGRDLPLSLALGPLGEVDQVAPVALLLPRNRLQVVTLPAQVEPSADEVPGPPVQAVAFDPSGRYVLAAGRRHLVVLRASDLRVVKMLDFGEEEPLGAASEVVVDPAGGAGHGPAVLVLHQRRYRAVALKVALPDE